MSRRALGSEHASQFWTNQSIVAEFGQALCLQATKRLTKFQVKKGLIASQDLPGSVGSFYRAYA